VAQEAEPLGIDPTALLQAVSDPAIKQRFKQETQTAMERGVFGSPFVIVDGEPFWGNDRLDQVDLWLEKGGW
jgi:2-hydroxychromene-2-carboxylate isomerase